MLDVPLVQSGCYVSMATSNDEDYPASNVIDGNEQTFWMTTGLFPQTLIITFPTSIEIKTVKLSCFGVKNYVIEKSTKSNPIEFDVIGEKSLKMEDQLKMMTNELRVSNGSDTRHIKIIVTEAYDSFVAIQHVRVDFAKGAR